MCLYLLSSCDELGRSLGRSASRCVAELPAAARTAGGLLLVLPGLLLGACFAGVFALLMIVPKWAAGSHRRVSESVRHYCSTLRAGVDAYQGRPVNQAPVFGAELGSLFGGGAPSNLTMPERIEIGVPPGVPGQPIQITHPRLGTFTVLVPHNTPHGGSFVVELPGGGGGGGGGSGLPPGTSGALLLAQRLLSDRCAACVAEESSRKLAKPAAPALSPPRHRTVPGTQAYCCCLPVFLVALVFVPLALAVELLLLALSAWVEGGRAGMLPPSLLRARWWLQVRGVVHDIDWRTSAAALGSPSAMLLSGCLSDCPCGEAGGGSPSVGGAGGGGAEGSAKQQSGGGPGPPAGGRPKPPPLDLV